jgi:hypothetical protein
MFHQSFRRFMAMFLLLGAFVLTQPFPANLVSAQKKSGKKSKKSKGPSSAPTTQGTPALWRDMGDISQLDLHWGIGSEDEQPKPPFQFDKEDVSGTNPKIKIIDANGVKWNMKFDEEVHAEVVSSRIAWAMGYMVEESYFVPSGTVNGVTGLGRAKKFIGSGGSFTDAMFEKRPDNIARRATPWAWDENPFVGTKELAGLGVVCFLLSNWDAKESNNNVLAMFDEDGKTVKEWFLVADWGGTFGKTGGFLSHSKWDAADYGKQAFIDGVRDGRIKFHYSGKMGSSLKDMPVENAKWITQRLVKLSDAQWRDAFKAGGATQTDTDAFISVLRRRLGELRQATGI